MLDFDKNSIVIIKPHPHTFDQRHKSRVPDLYNLDVSGINRLIRNIQSSYPNRLLLANPHSVNYDLLNEDYGCDKLLLTHHGTIGLEAQYLDLDIVCSSVAPYAHLGLSEKSFESKSELLRIINDYAVNTHSRRFAKKHLSSKALIDKVLSITYSRGDFNLEESTMDNQTIDFYVQKLMDKLLHATPPILS